MKGMKRLRNIFLMRPPPQTADGALEELTTIANRQKRIRTQASNGVNSTADLKALDDEFKQLNAEITPDCRKYNLCGYALKRCEADGVLVKGVTFQIGADGSEMSDIRRHTLRFCLLVICNFCNPLNTAIGAVDTLLAKVGTERSTSEAPMTATVLVIPAANLASVTENTKAVAGRYGADFGCIRPSNGNRSPPPPITIGSGGHAQAGSSTRMAGPAVIALMPLAA